MMFDRAQHDLEVMFELTASSHDGGQRTVLSGYRPHYRISDHYWTSAFHEFIGTDHVSTGQSAVAHVWLLSPEAYPASIWPGRKLVVGEGARDIGIAEVLKIFNPLLAI